MSNGAAESLVSGHPGPMTCEVSWISYHRPPSVQAVERRGDVWSKNEDGLRPTLMQRK